MHTYKRKIHKTKLNGTSKTINSCTSTLQMFFTINTTLYYTYTCISALVDLYYVHEAITNVFYIYTHKFERIIIQATSPNQLEFCRRLYKKCPLPEFDHCHKV